jgi:hypothetical protein
MPRQELFFEQDLAGRKIEVLKSYDEAPARQAFQSMDDDALQYLWNSLKPEEIYDPAGLPTPQETQGSCCFPLG